MQVQVQKIQKQNPSTMISKPVATKRDLAPSFSKFQIQFHQTEKQCTKQN